MHKSIYKIKTQEKLWKIATRLHANLLSLHVTHTHTHT